MTTSDLPHFWEGPEPNVPDSFMPGRDWAVCGIGPISEEVLTEDFAAVKCEKCIRLAMERAESDDWYAWKVGKLDRP